MLNLLTKYNKEELTTMVSLSVAFIILMLVFSLRLLCQEKFALYCRQDVLIQSDSILQAQIGVKEATGHNDGFMVAEYLKSVGLMQGQPYCYAGQYYCFDKSCQDLNLPDKFIPILKTGLANAGFTNAKMRGKKVSYKPAVNDLIVWRHKNSSNGHIERVISVQKAGWITTVGFNTSSGNSGSQRDGQGVFKRKRNIYYPLSNMAVHGLIGFESN